MGFETYLFFFFDFLNFARPLYLDDDGGGGGVSYVLVAYLCVVLRHDRIAV